MLRRSALSCVFVLATPSLLAQIVSASNPLPSDPEQFMQQAMQKNDIDLEGAEPWELKATFQLFDEHGVPVQTLTLDYIWVGPGQQRQTWSATSFHQTLFISHDRTFRTGDKAPIPDLIESALRTIVHPVPNSQEASATRVDMRKKKFGNVSYNCVASLPQSPAPSILPGGNTLIPRPIEYCFDPGTTNYRFTLSSDTKLESSSKTPFSTAQAGSQVSIVVGKVVRVTARIDDLRPIPAPNAQVFAPPAGAVDQNASATHAVGATGIKGGRLIHRVDAVLPASFQGPTQTLSLRGVIGTDGHVHSVSVLGTPNPDLAKAASDAVQQWIYEPYIWNGVPVEVGATITFTFGP